MPTHYSHPYQPTGYEPEPQGTESLDNLDRMNQLVERAQRDQAAAQLHLQRLVREVRTLRSERDEARRDLEIANQSMLFELARAAEHKDGEAGQHMRRIGVISAMIAEALGCPEDFCALMCDAAQMHDIGKIGIHESILCKPGPLSIDEWKLMREHPRIGAGILSAFKSPLMTLAAEISISHHEHFNGAGYPCGLAGEVIPLSGRIVGLADFFDALTMDRCYRKALPDEQVLQMIQERRGQQFDPHVVDVFMRIVDQIILARDSINEVEAICDLPDIHGDWWMAF